MRTTWVRVAGLLLAGTLALAACGGDGDGEDGGASTGTTGATGTSGPAEETIEVTASEFVFEPSELSASADTVTAIRVENVGSVEHDLTIDEASLKIATPASETVEGTLSLPVGTYTFYCSVPGHQEAGMEGTLTVS